MSATVNRLKRIAPSVFLALLLGLSVACSSDDNGGGGDAATDTTSPDTTSPDPDTGPDPDTSVPDVGPPPPDAGGPDTVGSDLVADTTAADLVGDTTPTDATADVVANWTCADIYGCARSSCDNLADLTCLNDCNDKGCASAQTAALALNTCGLTECTTECGATGTATDCDSCIQTKCSTQLAACTANTCP